MSANELEPAGTSPWPTWPSTHEPDLAPSQGTESDDIAPAAGKSWPILAEQTSQPHEILPGIVAEERPHGITLTRPLTSKATANLTPLDSGDFSSVALIVTIGVPGVGLGILASPTEALLKELFAPWLQVVLALCIVAALCMAFLVLFWVVAGLRAAVVCWLHVAGGRRLLKRRRTVGTELLFPALPVRLGEPTHVQFQQQRALGRPWGGPYASIRCEEWTKASDSTKVLWQDSYLRDFDAPASDAEFIRGAWQLELPPDMPPSRDTAHDTIRWILTVRFTIQGSRDGRVEYEYEFVVPVVAGEHAPQEWS